MVGAGAGLPEAPRVATGDRQRAARRDADPGQRNDLGCTRCPRRRPWHHDRRRNRSGPSGHRHGRPGRTDRRVGDDRDRHRPARSARQLGDGRERVSHPRHARRRAGARCRRRRLLPTRHPTRRAPTAPPAPTPTATPGPTATPTPPPTPSPAPTVTPSPSSVLTLGAVRALPVGTHARTTRRRRRRGWPPRDPAAARHRRCARRPRRPSADRAPARSLGGPCSRSPERWPRHTGNSRSGLPTARSGSSARARCRRRSPSSMPDSPRRRKAASSRRPGG